MGLVAVEKEPDEIIPLSADFYRTLETGDALQVANIDVVIKDAVTDADVTATVLVPSSIALDGTVISCRVQAGTLDHYYHVSFLSGETQFGHKYSPEITLAVVAAPSPTNLLVTLPEVKRAMGIAANDLSQDDLLEDLIRYASTYIRNETGLQFAIRQHRETIRPSERVAELDLRYTPVLAIESVLLESRDGDTVETLDADDVDFTRDGAVWRRDGLRWHRWPDKNIFTYRDGQPPPDDIVGAARGMTTLFYNAIGKEGFTSERIGDYVYERASMRDILGARGGIPDPTIEQVLGRYRQPHVWMG